VFQGIVLRGDYDGFRDASIRYRFRFCDDDIYFYLAERADEDYILWQLAHRGRWELIETSHPRYRERVLTVLQLQPEYIDVSPTDREAIRMLQERALPTDRLEKYLVSAIDLDGAWHPGVKKKTYYCTVPDPREQGKQVSWHIEPR
jgi:hypothetical protein